MGSSAVGIEDPIQAAEQCVQDNIIEALTSRRTGNAVLMHAKHPLRYDGRKIFFNRTAPTAQFPTNSSIRRASESEEEEDSSSSSSSSSSSPSAVMSSGVLRGYQPRAEPPTRVHPHEARRTTDGAEEGAGCPELTEDASGAAFNPIKGDFCVDVVNTFDEPDTTIIAFYVSMTPFMAGMNAHIHTCIHTHTHVYIYECNAHTCDFI